MFSAEMTMWSGGIAFSYFPAQSAQGQFGMVTISTDESTVTTSSDFQSLEGEYSNVTFLNSPLESADGAPTYPACPANNSVFLASPTLPPTPNSNACSCVENNLSCLFTPVTNNVTAIVGVLLDNACSLLGGKGGTCNDISSNGATGVYGLMSGCDPSMCLCIFYFYSQHLSYLGIELSYVMSQFYEITDKNSQSCNFAGNATLNPVTPTASASAVASSCFASASSVFTPSSPVTSGSSPTSTSKHGNDSVSLNLDMIVGMSVMAIVAVMSAVWTLV